MNIKINTLHLHLASNFAADAYDPDYTADALDPEIYVEPADSVMPDEEPDHAGLDPYQEIAAAIACELKNPGANEAPSWLVALVSAALRAANPN